MCSAMGYSISVRYPSKDSRDAALAMLQAWNWDVIGARAPQWQFSHPVPGEDLSYPPDGNPDRLLGFNRPLPTALEWTVAVWLACRSPYRNKAGNPVVFYDEEALPIVFNREPKADEQQRIRADAQGLMDVSRQSVFKRLFERRERVWLEAFLVDQSKP